jgi:hypothetical protein
MSDVIFLSNARLSFPNIVEPQKQRNETTGVERISYNCEAIVPRDHPGFAQFMQQYAALMQDVFKEHAQNVMQMIQADRKSRCFGMGEEKVNKKTFQPYDGYAGNYFITAGNKNRPQMIGPDGKAVNPDDLMAYQMLARKLYGGCRVNVAVKPWVQKNQHGNGFRFDLVAVQFFKDDAPFGESVVDASGLFGAVQPAAGPSASGAAMPGFMGGAGFAPVPPMPAAPFGAPTLPSFLGG